MPPRQRGSRSPSSFSILAILSLVSRIFGVTKSRDRFRRVVYTKRLLQSNRGFGRSIWTKRERIVDYLKLPRFYKKSCEEKNSVSRISSFEWNEGEFYIKEKYQNLFPFIFSKITKDRQFYKNNIEEEILPSTKYRQFRSSKIGEQNKNEGLIGRIFYSV